MLVVRRMRLARNQKPNKQTKTNLLEKYIHPATVALTNCLSLYQFSSSVKPLTSIDYSKNVLKINSAKSEVSLSLQSDLYGNKYGTGKKKKTGT